MTQRFLTFALGFLALFSMGVNAEDDTRPVVNVDEPAVCYTCHSDIEDMASLPHVHSALSDGKCSSCHNPHASRHATLLNENARELCLSCHDDVEKEAELVSVHRPAGKGDCISCHDPHASQYPNQLKSPPELLCETCHSELKAWMSRKVVHSPVEDAECGACHTPHGSDEGKLLKSSVSDLCVDCHDEEDFKDAHSGFQVAGTNCITCHDPHSSELPSLLMPNQHAPFKSKKGRSCHATSGTNAFALKAGVREVCTKCHSNIKKIAAQEYEHNLTDSLACLHCHNPHASAETPLLAGPQTTVCGACHFKGPEFAAVPEGQVFTHDGMDCSNCHQPHGSPNEHFFTRIGLSLCTDCHEDAHQGSHPVGADIIDPRTEESMTCLSCHQLHGAKFKPYLPLNPDMDLCIQCHRK